jgi:hypothetical protein
MRMRLCVCVHVNLPVDLPAWLCHRLDGCLSVAVSMCMCANCVCALEPRSKSTSRAVQCTATDTVIFACTDLLPCAFFCVGEHAQGGQFLWPGFHIGFERNITVPNGLADGPITLQTLSLRPLAFRVKHFLSGAECKHIVKLSKKHLQPSMVVQQASDNSEEQGTSAAHQSRTSSNTGLSRGATATVLRIERRAHEISRLPYELGEQLQVVKYDQGQKYEAHRDFFHSNDCASTVPLSHPAPRGHLWTHICSHFTPYPATS